MVGGGSVVEGAGEEVGAGVVVGGEASPAHEPLPYGRRNFVTSFNESLKTGRSTFNEFQ